MAWPDISFWTEDDRAARRARMKKHFEEVEKARLLQWGKDALPSDRPAWQNDAWLAAGEPK